MNSVVTIRVTDTKKNVTRLTIRSDNMEQKEIQKGKYDVWVDKTLVVNDYYFEAGGVFAINVYEDSNNVYVCIFLSMGVTTLICTVKSL